MDVFIGRFHPLIVHLPIGFIILAFLYECLCRFVPALKGNQRLIPVFYLLSFFAGILAVVSGLLLSESGAYGTDVLTTHKWLGITVTLLTLVVAGLKWKSTAVKPKVNFAISVVLILIVSLAGHYGGILTHGDDYLYEYAPRWVQTVAGYKSFDISEKLSQQQPDSVQLYSDFVRPILDARCTRCHNTEDASGGFNAATYGALFVEGESGTPVVPGSLSSSELFRRISLPTTSVRFMPPNGHPLSYAELNILRYWIENGADSLSHFEFSTMDEELVRLVKRDYSLDYAPRPYYEKVVVDSLSQDVIDRVTAAGFEVNYLGGDNFLLDVDYSGDTLNEETSAALFAVGGNITFLDLSGVIISDSSLTVLKELTHLTRLDLHGAEFSDAIFENLAQLEHLEVLNVYNTKTGAQGLLKALASPSLKRVYVWQTSLSPEEIDQAESRHPGIQFDRGLTLIAPDTTAASASTGTP